MNPALFRLRDELLRGERVVGVDGQLAQIDAAVAWLENCRHSEGYWGVEDVAATALCCLAIGRARPRTARALLGVSASWLISQAVGGRWDSYWDTAMAVQALIIAGHRGDQATREALEVLREFDADDEQLWSFGLHHPAQILCALAVAGASTEVLDRWTQSLVNHLPTTDIYVCAQGVYACLAHGTAGETELAAAIELLVRYVSGVQRPSEGDLRDFAPAIQALSAAPSCADLVADKAGSILSAFNERRAWYGDARQTAWSLLALHEARRVKAIVIDKPTLNRAFRVASKEVPQGQRRARLYVAGLTTGVIVSVEGLVAVLVGWNDKNSVLVSGIPVAVLVTLIFVLVPSLIKVVRSD